MRNKAVKIQWRNKMPNIRQPIRIVQKSTKENLLINLPADETGWKVGDVIRFENQDEDTIILKRLRERDDTPEKAEF